MTSISYFKSAILVPYEFSTCELLFDQVICPSHAIRASFTLQNATISRSLYSSLPSHVPNMVSDSPPPLASPKPQPVHTVSEVYRLLLILRASTTYSRQSLRSTTPLLFRAKLSSGCFSPRSQSLQKESHQ